MQTFKKDSPLLKKRDILNWEKISSLNSGSNSSGDKSKLTKIKRQSVSKYHNLWQFKFLEILRDEHGFDLSKFIKPWQLLEFDVFKVLTENNLIVRYSQPFEDNNLRSSDFTVLSRNGDVQYVIECKYVGCSGKVDPIKYCKAVVKSFREEAVYVVNDEFFKLLRLTIGLSLKRIVNVKGLKALLKS